MRNELEHGVRFLRTGAPRQGRLLNGTGGQSQRGPSRVSPVLEPSTEAGALSAALVAWFRSRPQLDVKSFAFSRSGVAICSTDFPSRDVLQPSASAAASNLRP